MKNDIFLDKPMPVKIASIGHYVPRRVVSSRELESRYDLDEGWCWDNLGIRERRWAVEETASFMGAQAAREALLNAGKDLTDIDFIINASYSYEKVVPDGGPLIQNQLGPQASGIPSTTIHANCLSFPAALELGASMLVTGCCNHILIVSSELLSLNIDFSIPHVGALFGDGAAALVITRTPDGENSGITGIYFENYTHDAFLFQSGIGLAALQKKELTAKDLALQMDYHHFMEAGQKYTNLLLDKIFNEKNIHHIKKFIPQQLGKKYLEGLNIFFPGEKQVIIFDRFGFCGAASLPMALYETIQSKQLLRGEPFLLLGIGAGLSLGGMIMTY
jgi:3-oxoacyl-[acyl-carrier-protein] synthase-3